MTVILRRGRVPGVVGLVLILVVVAECRGQSACQVPDAGAGGPVPSGTVVLRPASPGNVRARKPWVLPGYAGAVYPPIGQGPLLNPTGYWVRPDQPYAPPRRSWWWR